MGKSATGALIAAGMLRGANFLFVSLLVDQIAAPEVVAGRLSFAAMVACGFLILRGALPRLSIGMLGAATVLAMLDNVAPYTLLAFAQTRIDSGLAAILATTAPLFTMLAAVTLARDERFSPVRVGGLLLGLSGVVVLTGGGVLAVTRGDGAAIAAVMLASVSYGGSIVYARHLLRSHDVMTLTAVKLTAGALQALGLVFLFGGTPEYGSLDGQGWLFLATLGVAGTGIAYFLHFWAVARVGSVRGSMVTYVSPAASLLLGWLLLGEALTTDMLVGVTMIASAVATVMYAPNLESHLKGVWCSTAGRNSNGCAVVFAPTG